MANKNKELTTREIFQFIERMATKPQDERFAIASLVVWMETGKYEDADGRAILRRDYKRELARIKRIGLTDIWDNIGKDSGKF
jgi:hypothetical protein